MTPKADNKFKQVLSHQHAYGKGSITKQLLKNVLEWNLITKISGSNSYIYKTRYQNPNTHSNEKL